MKSISLLTTVTLFMISLGSAAKSQKFDLALKLLVNGQEKASPRLVVNSGQEASIIEGSELEKYSIQLVAQNGAIQGRSGILIKFKVSEVKKDGSSRIFSEPHLLAQANQPAEISVGNSDGSTMTLIVLAKPLAR